MVLTKSLTLGLAAAALIATSDIAVSQTDLPPAVSARKAQMHLYAFNLATLGGMAQEKIAYDADAASAAAGNLAKLSSLDASAMWVPGTDAATVAGSRALPALWDNMDDVITKAVALNEAATEMNAVAADGLDALKAAMGPLGAACGACHKAYREPE